MRNSFERKVFGKAKSRAIRLSGEGVEKVVPKVYPKAGKRPEKPKENT
jgi:hypothetical protein